MQDVTEEQGKRLKELREQRYETAADAARAHGWPVTTYQAHENGSRGLKLDIARRYAKAFSSSAAFILTGAASKTSDGTLSYVNPITSVPIIARVSAGTFRYDEPVTEGGILVPAVPRVDIPASAQYSVRIDGQSVNKRVPDGAYAVCAYFDKFPGGAQHGQLVHVVRERAGLHEHTIKELRFSNEGMMLYPVSTDASLKGPIKLNSGDDDEIVRIHGIVIGWFQPI